MNMQALMKQAQKMQKDMAVKEQELQSKMYEGSIGGGVIQVAMNGQMEFSKIEISPSLMQEESAKDVEEMLMLVINDVIQQATVEKDEAMKKLSGGMKMPGGF